MPAIDKMERQFGMDSIALSILLKRYLVLKFLAEENSTARHCEEVQPVPSLIRERSNSLCYKQVSVSAGDCFVPPNDEA